MDWNNIYAINVHVSEEDPLGISEHTIQIYNENGYCGFPFLMEISE